MSFPLYYILILYLSFLIVWAVFSFVAFYHMLKYGFRNFTTFFIIIIYILISVFLLMLSFRYLGEIDWQVNVAIFDNIFNNDFPYQ